MGSCRDVTSDSLLKLSNNFRSDLLPRATLRRYRAPPCAFVFATLRRYRAPQRATVLFEFPSYKSLFFRHFHIRSGVDGSDVGSTSTRARTRCADHCERTRATHTLPSSKDEIECKETVSHSASYCLMYEGLWLLGVSNAARESIRIRFGDDAVPPQRIHIDIEDLCVCEGFDRLNLQIAFIRNHTLNPCNFSVF